MLLCVASPTRAYPPPPAGCPQGSHGVVGGFCVPLRCSGDHDCARGLRCRAAALPIETVDATAAGPYPTERLYDPNQPGAAATTAEGAPSRAVVTVPVCLPDGERTSHSPWTRGLAGVLLLLAGVAVWRRQHRQRTQRR